MSRELIEAVIKDFTRVYDKLSKVNKKLPEPLPSCRVTVRDDNSWTITIPKAKTITRELSKYKVVFSTDLYIFKEDTLKDTIADLRENLVATLWTN